MPINGLRRATDGQARPSARATLRRLRVGRLGAIAAVLTVFLTAAMAPAATAATVSPSTLSFETQVDTTSASETVTITNDGPLSASVIVVPGGDDGDRFGIDGNTCGVSVDAGASCTVDVTFSPDTARAYDAVLNVTVGLDLSTVALQGIGTAAPPPAPDAQVSPSSLTFSTQAGTTSTGQRVTLENTGEASLTISSVAIVGRDSGRFDQDGGCSGTLVVRDSCTVTVTFRPVAEGLHTATLEFNDDAPSGTQRVTLSGTATSAPPPPAPGAQVSPGSLSFATQAGTTSGGRQVTLKNTGTATLNIASIALVGPDAPSFAKPNDTCGTSLAAGLSCTVTVSFSPAQAGDYDAVLRFTDDAPGGTQEVNLNGSANAVPGAEVSPDSLTFAAQVGTTNGPRRVTLTNDGLAALRITSIRLTGTGATNFTIPAETCETTLAAGDSCTVDVAFAPSTAGEKQATLLFTDDAPSRTQRVTLEGTATAAPPRPAPFAEVSPGRLSFSTLAGTSRSGKVTLNNSGNATLNIASIGVVGPDASGFSVLAKTCGAALAAGASCTVTVEFSPAQPGDYEAVLRFTDDAAGGKQDVDLDGSANAVSGAEVSPDNLTFAAQVGTTSRPIQAKLTNDGLAPLNITSIKLTGAGASNFTIPGTTCPTSSGSTLAPGATCTVDVAFAPSTTGEKQATLLFTDDAPSRTQRVTLEGTATITPPPAAPAAEVAPSSLAFAAQAGTTSGAFPVTLKNTGNAPLRDLAVALVGQDAADFKMTGNTCTATLAAGASCTVDVTFSPTTTNQSAARLRFTHNAPNPTTEVPLSGTLQAVAPSSGVASAVVTRPPVAGPKPVPFAPASDADRDGTPDSKDACPTAPGDLANGCQRALGADVRGIWRVNQLFTQLRNLTVRAPTGSRIDVRCSGARRVCPFKTRVIARTTRRVTNLTNWFKRPRILPAGVVLTVRVTRAGRIGTYERLLTRRGRLLPKVTERCINHQKRLIRCV